ncbi:hypothetical protein Tco_0827544 [Tanacetum coccineum]
MIAEEIKKLVEGTENVGADEVDSSILRQNDNQNDPRTRLELRSNKESLEVEITAKVQPINVNEDEEESVEDDYELKQKGKREECRGLQGRYRYLFEYLKTRFMPRKKFHELAQYLQEVMEESLSKMVDTHVKELTKTQVPIYVAQGLIMERQQSQADVAKMIADASQQERKNLRAKISSQINNAITNHIPSQVDSCVKNYMSGHILHVHPTQTSPASTQEQQYQLYLTMKDNPQLQQDDLLIWLTLKYKFERPHVSNTSCIPYVVRPRDQDDHHDDAHPERENSNQEQLDDFDFWTDSYATDDDELPTEKVSQEHVEEMSQSVDEAKLHKVPTPVIQSCQRDPKAPSLSLVNQDLLYLKKGNSGPKKIVDKCVKKFNPYARYSVEHWKNPHAKIFYIKKQKEHRKPKEVVYSNSKIVQIIKTYWDLGHEHNFITDIIARRANGSIVSITESDYKNLNKNDIKDLYMLIVNGKVDDYVETGLMWSLSVFIRSTNNKKEKRVMRHQEFHKFCDATLKRVLEGLKIYNNNVKHGYVTLSLSKEDAEYLQLFQEGIEECLKHHDQMRH